MRGLGFGFSFGALFGHAVEPFWNWMASWSRMATMPSDLGDSDEGFILPPMRMERHRAESSQVVTGGLFGDAVMSATSMHEVKRQTSDARARMAAEIACSTSEPVVIWVDTDYDWRINLRR